MTETIRERYEKLRKYIGIDLLDLETDFMRVPHLFDEMSELCALSTQMVNIAKHNLDVATANASMRIREPLLGAPQTQIDRELKIMVPLQPEVIAARTALNEALYEADHCDKLFTTLKEQSRLLGKAADMANSGYLNPQALHEKRREEYHAARSERVKRPRE